MMRITRSAMLIIENDTADEIQMIEFVRSTRAHKYNLTHLSSASRLRVKRVLNWRGWKRDFDVMGFQPLRIRKIYLSWK